MDESLRCNDKLRSFHWALWYSGLFLGPLSIDHYSMQVNHRRICGEILERKMFKCEIRGKSGPVGIYDGLMRTGDKEMSGGK